LSVEEFIEGHKNMYLKMDADKDGFITKEEMQIFRESMKKKSDK